MSISGLIHTGQSALVSVQTQMSVTSTNIANASTEGYTAKRAQLAPTVTSSKTTGVQVVDLGNQVDKALVGEIIIATSAAAYDATVNAYLDAALSALGTTVHGSDLEASLTNLTMVLNDAVGDGGDAAAQADIVAALTAWTDSLNTATASLQATRTAADEAIGDAVDEVNALLVELDDLNREISLANATGHPTADLLDSQRVALEKLSGYLEVNHYTTSMGELRVYSGGGQPLLASTPHTLSYAPFGPMTAEAVYDPAKTGGIGGIMVGGQDVTAELTGGEIGALIDIRDQEVPALQAELDALAVGVADALNAAANAAAPVPAPPTLTSDTVVVPTDALSATGTVTVLETDADGTVIGATDIDLSAMATYQDVIDAMDLVAGVSASLDGDGRLVVSADTAGHGVTLTGDTEIAADGRGLSHHLGFNNLVAGSGASDLAAAATLESQGLPVAVPASAAVGDVALAAGDASGIAAIWKALDMPITFDGAGHLPATEKSAVTQTAAIIDDLADRSAAAADRADISAGSRDTLATRFDNQHGVNTDEELARLTALEQSYQASTQIITTAQAMFDSLMAMMK